MKTVVERAAPGICIKGPQAFNLYRQASQGGFRAGVGQARPVPADLSLALIRRHVFACVWFLYTGIPQGFYTTAQGYPSPF